MPRAKKPRKPVESPALPKHFDVAAFLEKLTTHERPCGVGSWSLERILGARNAHALGRFAQSAQLATAILTDGAVFKAVVNRLAPHRGLPRGVFAPVGVELEGSPAAILAEAHATFGSDASSSLPPAVLTDLFLDLAVCELAIAQIQWMVRPDGSRHDAFVSHFPLAAVEWEEHTQKLFAWTKEEGRVEIVHGDGRWIVLRRYSTAPWAKAALLPLSVIWADRAFGVRDRSANAESHGDDKWIGMLPDGVPIDSAEGKAMLEQLVKLYEKRRAMIAPFGATVKRDEAMGQNWQIFKELIESDARDANGVMLGQDGNVADSSQRLTPQQLFGVRNDLVESDLSTACAGLSTGLIRPWAMVNFGRWDRLEYRWQMPDADEEERRASIATRREALWKDLESARASGAVVDQKYVDARAKDFGVSPPRLADEAPSGAEIYAYDIENGIVTIDEARKRKGLGPREDGFGWMTAAQDKARIAALAPSQTPIAALPAGEPGGGHRDEAA